MDEHEPNQGTMAKEKACTHAAAVRSWTCIPNARLERTCASTSNKRA
jgi:hypothetical protein